jgi:adenosylmethionine-8-amino-7-oxononanoate aminotransferase
MIEARETGMYSSNGGANGLDGDATVIKPPLPTARENLDKILDLMAETLTEVQKNYL